MRYLRAFTCYVAATIVLASHSQAQTSAGQEVIDPAMKLQIETQINNNGYNCLALERAWVMGYDEFGVLIRAACRGNMRFRMSLHPKTGTPFIRLGW